MPSNNNEREQNGRLCIEQIYKGMVSVNHSHDCYFIKVKADVRFYDNGVCCMSLVVSRVQRRLLRQDYIGMVLGST